jgi:hypothetical protein
LSAIIALVSNGSKKIDIATVLSKVSLPIVKQSQTFQKNHGIGDGLEKILRDYFGNSHQAILPSVSKHFWNILMTLASLPQKKSDALSAVKLGKCDCQKTK